jgi:DNA-binding MarR family transcriptional regulator
MSLTTSRPRNDSATDRLLARAVELQLAINRELRGLAPDPWRELELTMPQLKVLLLLDALGPSRVGALAHELGVKLPTLTGILDRLVEAGLVRREEDPRDRRVVIAQLTPDGAALVERLQQASRVRLERVYARLDPTELRALARLLEAVLAAARAERAAARAEPGGRAPSGVGDRG